MGPGMRLYSLCFVHVLFFKKKFNIYTAYASVIYLYYLYFLSISSLSLHTIFLFISSYSKIIRNFCTFLFGSTYKIDRKLIWNLFLPKIKIVHVCSTRLWKHFLFVSSLHFFIVPFRDLNRKEKFRLFRERKIS